jgi:hypothetical protein
MADRDRSPDHGGGGSGTADACAHRHDEGAQSARRAGVRSFAQGEALGTAEA